MGICGSAQQHAAAGGPAATEQLEVTQADEAQTSFVTMRVLAAIGMEVRNARDHTATNITGVLCTGDQFIVSRSAVSDDWLLVISPLHGWAEVPEGTAEQVPTAPPFEGGASSIRQWSTYSWEDGRERAPAPAKASGGGQGEAGGAQTTPTAGTRRNDEPEQPEDEQKGLDAQRQALEAQLARMEREAPKQGADGPPSPLREGPEKPRHSETTMTSALSPQTVSTTMTFQSGSTEAMQDALAHQAAMEKLSEKEREEEERMDARMRMMAFQAPHGPSNI